MTTADKTGSPQFVGAEIITCPTAPPPGGICLRDRGRMHRRLKGADGECRQFHVMSRTAGGEFLFGDVEKEAFRLLMWRLARFSGVEILTYCVMGNHFHLLIQIPKREEFLRRFDGDEPGGEGEQRLMGHLKLLYSKAYLRRLAAEIAELRRRGREVEVQRVFDRFKARMCDLSLFVKELKERFSRWFNKRHLRRGTLWMERFRSVMVEGGVCLRTMAAYIDLNPVRAGIIERPEDYRWCGYAEALGGSVRMRRGLCRAIGWPIDHWGSRGHRGQSAGEAYRCLLYEDGLEREGKTGGRHGIPVDAVREVIGRGGRLGHFQLVRCRLRWFSEGGAIGSQSFLRGVLGEGGDGVGLEPVPVAGEPSSWFSLSRLRRQGIG